MTFFETYLIAAAVALGAMTLLWLVSLAAQFEHRGSFLGYGLCGRQLGLPFLTTLAMRRSGGP
ncbi:MAG: hypothetical protein ACP5JJ_00905, partial [Anaerolineae bacterium]